MVLVFHVGSVGHAFRKEKRGGVHAFDLWAAAPKRAQTREEARRTLEYHTFAFTTKDSHPTLLKIINIISLSAHELLFLFSSVFAGMAYHMVWL